ncbi:MAG: hypothetical protein JNJ83_09005 [Verrucomicrobiaceae bacterium]|nr:hypothetical protein [Verrucomicrobiaceae bacterium]
MKSKNTKHAALTAMMTGAIMSLCSCSNHYAHWHKAGATPAEARADYNEALVRGSIQSTKTRWTPAFAGDGYEERIPDCRVVEQHMKNLGYKRISATSSPCCDNLAAN